MSGRLAPGRCRAAPSSIGTGKSAGSLVGSCAPGASLIAVSKVFGWHESLRRQELCIDLARLRIRHEFHQRAVRIAEIDAGAGTLGAETLHRSGFDSDAAAL